MKRWSGVAIQPAGTATVFVTESVLLLAILALLSAIAIIQLTSKRNMVFLKATTIATVMIFAGCEEQGDPVSPPPLTLDQPLVNLGLVPNGKTIPVSFPFQINANGVVITNLKKSCHCIDTSSNDLIMGKPLAVGDHQQIRFDVRIEGSPSDPGNTDFRVVEIVTAPPSPHPLLATVAYRCSHPPYISPGDVRVDTSLDKPVDVKLKITYRRSERDARAWPVPEKCQLGEWTWVAAKYATEVVETDQQHRIAVDVCSLQLRWNGQSTYGTYSSSMTLGFADHASQTIPVLVNVRHPFHLSLSRIYAGRLKPNQAWAVSLPFTQDTDDIRVNDISSENGVVVKTSDGHAVVEGIAPSASGRFEGKIVFQFDPSSVPKLELPYSGFVE